MHCKNISPTDRQVYLTAAEVSALTGFSRKTLERYRSLRRGPPFLKIGRSVRYRLADVTAWLEAGEVR